MDPKGNGLPEPMNNYNLPNEEELAQKLKILEDYYPTFANKSVEDLEDMLKYNDLFQSHFSGIEQVQMTRTLQYELRQQGLALAIENLEKKPRLDELRSQAEHKSVILNSLTTDFVETSSSLLEIQRKYSRKAMIQALAEKISFYEQETERILHEYLQDQDFLSLQKSPSGKIYGNNFELENTNETYSNPENKLDSFLKDFIACRTKYHLLAAKNELIQES
ncbi:hypothetical protein BB560_003506 [Smittium megazygosporum]|uniref:VPS37 C-terminal domain-containing protein n=1 Tax=Smittium megazygosporum TaxID=133381 RepID=A0A2T9ZBX1_9FUNG|nr:hypothetical protein BB560_003506 [Smittium megazygosporum]